MRKKLSVAVGLILGIVLLAAAGYLIWCSQLEDEVIWPDYVINEVSIKGMTVPEAREAIQEKFKEDYGDSAITVKIADREYSIPVFPALEMTVEDILENAYLPGHREWYKRGVDRYRLNKNAQVYTCEVLPYVADETVLYTSLDETDICEVDTVVQTTWDKLDDSLVITKGSKGIKADVEQLKERIREAVYDQDFNAVIECPAIETVPDPLDLEPFYDEIYQEKAEAVMDKKDYHKISQSQTGVSFDLEQAEQDFENAEDGEVLTIKYVYEEPELTTDELKSMLFRDVLGEASSVGGGTFARKNNITIAADFCNETVLMPGETFSYNDTVGERSADRGFQVATVYANGTAVPGIGGGICQVSSTIFDAALYADMEIVERQNHSLTVSYLPLGMDATVNWGTVDFKFKNTSDYPVKLLVTYIDGEVKTVIMGTKTDDTQVEITTESTGGLGVVTYRIHKDKDGNEIDKEKVAVSRYQGYH